MPFSTCGKVPSASSLIGIPRDFPAATLSAIIGAALTLWAISRAPREPHPPQIRQEFPPSMSHRPALLPACLVGTREDEGTDRTETPPQEATEVSLGSARHTGKDTGA